MRVAIMVACYNRRESTEKCLFSLMEQLKQEADKTFDIYVYDDCSTDGTVEMLNENFPEAIVIRGKGNAYWCRSMHFLMKRAIENEYDFYLMINDDVTFFHDAVKTMFVSYQQAGCSCGIVGATRSAVTQCGTYGGRNENGELLLPDGTLKRCVWADWNCFLIDKEVVKINGVIDGKYQHAWGDFDYDYRMIKNEIPIFEAVKYIGECENNSKTGTYMDSTLNRLIRIKKLFSPKGLPFYSYLRYNVKTKGIAGVPLSIYGYCSLIGYILLKKEIN